MEGGVAHVFDRRLLAKGERPIALGLSGGGDSVALLLAADAWARAHGRRLLVLTVDHQLQPQSRAWTTACAERAARLGVEFQALAWEGEKPERGLPAAARAARHRLLADAAREAGARVLLLGHTADDVLEARAMRAAGATTPEPREWAPSPAWPEGRGLFLLRPMLALRRARLREALRARGERWIDDPANADLRYARPRARAALEGDALPDLVPEAALTELWTPLAGGFEAPRRSLSEASELERLLAVACVCAGGGARLPRRAAVQRLAGLIRAAGPVSATLAGSRIQADESRVLIVRDAGETARGGLTPLALQPGVATVWDGRFEITAGALDLQVRKLGGLSGCLAPDQQRALAALPAPLRPGLPAIVDADGGVSCPLLGASKAAALSLTEDRLAAAIGRVTREPD